MLQNCANILSSEAKQYLSSVEKLPIVQGSCLELDFERREAEILALTSSNLVSQKIEGVNHLLDLFTECLDYDE